MWRSTRLNPRGTQDHPSHVEGRVLTSGSMPSYVYASSNPGRGTRQINGSKPSRRASLALTTRGRKAFRTWRLCRLPTVYVGNHAKNKYLLKKKMNPQESIDSYGRVFWTKP